MPHTPLLTLLLVKMRHSLRKGHAEYATRRHRRRLTALMGFGAEIFLFAPARALPLSC